MADVKEKVEVVAAEEAAPVKKTRTRKAAAPKAEKVAAEKAEEVKEEKPAKKAAAKKDPKTTVTIQFGGNDYAEKDILAAVKKAYTKAYKGVTVKTVEVYVKPEEGAAYYVVNGEGSEDMKVEL